MEGKTRVKPVIIGATGSISKSFRKYISNIPGNHEVKEIHKTAILGTAHTLRKHYYEFTDNSVLYVIGTIRVPLVVSNYTL